jgi:hypothetical protein
MLAHPALQIRGDSHPVPHPDLFCQMYVTVAQFGTRFRYHIRKLKQPYYLLLCNIPDQFLPVPSRHR